MTAATEMTPEHARRELERLGPLSPELVLVAPELAELARRALEVPLRQPQDGRDAPSPPIGFGWQRRSSRRRPSRSRRALVAAGAFGFALGVAATGWVGVRRQPAPIVEPAPRAAVDAAVLPTSRRGSESGARLRPLRSGARRERVTSQTHVAAETRRRPRRRPPLRPIGPPNAGYIFGKSGQFRISAHARAVVGFMPDPRCGELFTLRPMQVARDGRFSFTGAPPATGDKARIVVRGRFVTRTLVRGTIHLRTNRCDSGVYRFTARLS